MCNVVYKLVRPQLERARLVMDSDHFFSLNFVEQSVVLKREREREREREEEF